MRLIPLTYKLLKLVTWFKSIFASFAAINGLLTRLTFVSILSIQNMITITLLLIIFCIFEGPTFFAFQALPCRIHICYLSVTSKTFRTSINNITFQAIYEFFTTPGTFILALDSFEKETMSALDTFFITTHTAVSYGLILAILT